MRLARQRRMPSAPPLKQSSETASGEFLGSLCANQFTHRFPLLPILRDADADQLGIGQEHIGCQAAIVAVQEVAGDRSRVEHVFVVEHHLPAVLVGEDQRQVDVGVTPQPIVRIIVEHSRPGVVLPIIIPS